MALVRTTLSAAIAADDMSMVVASATSFAAGRIVLIDQEVMKVGAGYVSGTTIPFAGRGLDGTKAVAHVITAGVVHGLASDFAAPAAGTAVGYPPAGRGCEIRSITATSTLALPTPGSDLRVILNGTAAITLTIPVPTVDMDGTILTISGNGVAAHLLTFTGGLSGAGASYDVITANATAPTSYMFIASNALWHAIVGVPMAGTVTNITGTVA